MSYFNRALKTDKNGIPVPQIFNPAVNDFQVLEGSGNQMPMSDAGAHARLDAIEQKIDGIIDGTTPASVQLTGSNVEVVWQPPTALTTGTNYLSNLDVSDSTDIYFVVVSSLDAPVRFLISLIGGRGIISNIAKIDDGSGNLHDLKLDIPANANRAYILKPPTAFFATSIRGALYLYNGDATSGSVAVYVQKKGGM